jgi:transposase-like protein
MRGSKPFLDRPLEGDWPYVWVNTTNVKVRRNHRIVSVAAIVAVGSTRMAARGAGHEHRPLGGRNLWTEVLRKLRRRGVKLVMSDAHEEIKAAVAKLTNGQLAGLPGPYNAQRVSRWRREQPPRCLRVHRDSLRPSAEAAKMKWRRIAYQLRPKLPKLAGFMDEAEHDVLAYMSFPRRSLAEDHSTKGGKRDAFDSN